MIGGSREVGSKRLGGKDLCIALEWMDFLFWNFGDVFWEYEKGKNKKR